MLTSTLPEFPVDLHKLIVDYAPLHCDKCKVPGCESSRHFILQLRGGGDTSHTHCECCARKCTRCTSHDEVCDKCEETCDICKLKLCFYSQRECTLCDRVACASHFKRICDTCQVYVCSSCVRKCKKCANITCAQCAQTTKCNNCRSRLCLEESCRPRKTSKRHECHNEVCAQCEVRCAICNDADHCMGCLLRCFVCKANVCVECLKTDIVCNKCFATEKICTSCDMETGTAYRYSYICSGCELEIPKYKRQKKRWFLE